MSAVTEQSKNDKKDQLQPPNQLELLGRAFHAIKGSYADATSLNTQSILGGLQFSDWKDKGKQVTLCQKKYVVPKDGVMCEDSQTGGETRTIQGTTRSEFQKELAIKASLKASYCGFSGSVNSNYGTNVSSSNTSFYKQLSEQFKFYTLGISIDSVDLSNTSKDTSTRNFWISKSLKDAFDSLDATRIGDAEQAVVFFEKWGTHVLTGIVVGAKLEMYLEGTQSSFTSEREFDVCCKAGYASASGSVSAAVDVSGKEIAKESSANSKNGVKVLGGRPAEVAAYELAIKSKKSTADLKKAYLNWVDSLKGDGAAWIDYSANGSTPIWDFCADKDKREYLQKTFAQLYTPSLTRFNPAATRIDLHPDSPYTGAERGLSFEVSGLDEVIVGIGGNVNGDKHMSDLVVITNRINSDCYTVHYLGNATEDTDFEAFYLAPEGYLITGIAVGENEDKFSKLWVWSSKLNRTKQGGFLDADRSLWKGASRPKYSKVRASELKQKLGTGWCEWGLQPSEGDMQIVNSNEGKNSVLTSIRLISSNQSTGKQWGFCRLDVTYSQLKETGTN